MGAVTVTLLFVAAVLTGICSARTNNNVGTISSGFPINTLLTCNVPFFTRTGIAAVPETTLNVPFRPGNPYTPLPSGYADKVQ